VRVTQKVSQQAGTSAILAALVAGLGVIIMILALAVGAIQATAADANVIGLTFAGGLALFIIGFAGWVLVAQPHKHLDDINQPAPDDHHHDSHDEEPAPDSHPAHS